MMDLISREDALAVVRYSKNAVDGIENLPSVDAVEVKHGEWEIKGNRKFCSECGSPALFYEGGTTFATTYRQYKTPYCAYCGAAMDGKRDAE